MTVSLLAISHNGIADEMIESARCIFSDATINIESLSIPANLKPDNLGAYVDQVRNKLAGLKSQDGTLILTDLFGATPDNLARYFAKDHNAQVVSGMSLPMLVSLFNNRQKSLIELSEIAVQANKRGTQN
ncbi:MAG: PTS system mannose-specific IIA component [Gammaproteobacteria bacterium]|jgi:PTS system mannose-specific IIA component